MSRENVRKFTAIWFAYPWNDETKDLALYLLSGSLMNLYSVAQLDQIGESYCF